jgi:dihydroflavonol-4-reductase
VSELQHDQPFDESRPYKTSVDEVYDYSKAIGEQNILKMKGGGGPEVVIIRPSAVLGPFDFKISEMGKALIDFYRGKVPALPEGGFDFVDVRDVAGAIVAAIDKGNDGEIFLVTGKYYRMQELSATIRNVMGIKTPALVIPYNLLRWSLPFIKLFAKITGAAPVFTLSSINTLKFGHPNMSHQKAALKLNYNPRPLEESIREFYDWARSGHLIN